VGPLTDRHATAVTKLIPADSHPRFMRRQFSVSLLCLVVLASTVLAAPTAATPAAPGPTSHAAGEVPLDATDSGAVSAGDTAFQAGSPDDAPNACVGTMEEPANGMTVISVQGFDRDGPNRARLVGVGPEGEVQWVHRNGKRLNVVWGYDVDPLPNGYVFVTATFRKDGEGHSAFYKLDARTGEVVWRETLPYLDTHDADLLDEHRIAIAHMRNPNPDEPGNDDRLVVYNRTSDEVEWAWYFDDHYDSDVGGNYSEDWTHVNDIDRVGEDKFLASPRNFDQVILVNQTTGDIELKLGSYGDRDVLHKQHNPDYLESESGDPTFLVADSENNRIVEYEHDGDDWTRTWTLTGDLRWPRDADRLPDGNTLVTDSRGDRVMEVTPDGEVVWEFYAPPLIYDAERVQTGDGSKGPTMADRNETGSVSLSGDADFTEEEIDECGTYLDEVENDWPGRDDGSDDGTGDGTDSRDGTDGDASQGTTEDVRGFGESTKEDGSPVALPAGGALLAIVALAAAVLLGRRRD
jgi:hypothetical protein